MPKLLGLPSKGSRSKERLANRSKELDGDRERVTPSHRSKSHASKDSSGSRHGRRGSSGSKEAPNSPDSNSPPPAPRRTKDRPSSQDSSAAGGAPGSAASASRRSPSPPAMGPKESVGSFKARTPVAAATAAAVAGTKESVGSSRARGRSPQRAFASTKDSAGSWRTTTQGSKELSGIARRRSPGLGSKESGVGSRGRGGYSSKESSATIRSGKSAGGSSARSMSDQASSESGRAGRGGSPNSRTAAKRPTIPGSKSSVGSGSSAGRGSSTYTRRRELPMGPMGSASSENWEDTDSDLEEFAALENEEGADEDAVVHVEDEEKQVPASTDSEFQRTETIPHFIEDTPPTVYVLCGKRWLCIQLSCAGIWMLTVAGLLCLYGMRFFGALGEGMHRDVCNEALRNFEVNVSGAFIPALSLARALALGVKSGFFNGGSMDPYAALRTIVAAEMALAPTVVQAQVLGLASDRMVRALPGRINDPTAAARDRVPLIYAVSTQSCRSPIDRWICFGLNSSGVQMSYSAPHQASLAWLGPAYMQIGPEGLALSQAEWTLTHHLLATVNLTVATGAQLPPQIGVDVSVQLDGVAAAARDIVPAKGGLLLLTADGWLLAGSQPEAPATTSAGKLGYKRAWDLPMSWASLLTPALLAKQVRSEIKVGRDMLVVRPMRFGADATATVDAAPTSSASAAAMPLAAPPPGVAEAAALSMRVVVFVPRDVAVRPVLEQLVYAGLGVLASPFVTVAALVFLWLLWRTLRYCVYLMDTYM